MASPVPEDLSDLTDPRALIEAARKRQRRRRRRFVLVVVALIVIGMGAYLAVRSVGGVRRSAPQRAAAAIRLERPGALVLGARGVLCVADDGRDQIVARLPSGAFRVVAGTGKPGFSGDGGPATRARINRPGGMVLGRDGTLYFADEANGRIRAIAPDGVISTVVGDGRFAWIRSGTPARVAPLGNPSAVTIGSDERLYIAAFGTNQVLRLEKDGTLTRIAGSRQYAGVKVNDIGHPAVDESPAVPDGLAFDRTGNLYIAGFSVKVLLMITPRGIMERPDGIGGFYPRGDGALTEGPDGTVLAADTLRIDRLTPHGIAPVADFSRSSFAAIRYFLPQGIAVAPDGTIYTDTWLGNGYANGTALVAFRPGGTPHVLWKG